LRDVTITIAPGEIIALVGASGAGKTTFINLIPRFYDVTAGRITLNGLDIREASLADLRNHIALVSQQPILFNDTIYNNIALGRPDSTPAPLHATNPLYRNLHDLQNRAT
jgi:subfamily B ATP-binding cassette protein MsbA